MPSICYVFLVTSNKYGKVNLSLIGGFYDPIGYFRSCKVSPRK